MHIKFNVCQRLQATWSFVIFLNQGSQRLQSVLDMLACRSKPANAVITSLEDPTTQNVLCQLSLKYASDSCHKQGYQLDW